MVKFGFKATEGTGLDTCVLAMKAALGVYVRAGFKLVDQVVQNASHLGGETEYAAYFLIRGEEGKDGNLETQTARGSLGST